MNTLEELKDAIAANFKAMRELTKSYNNHEIDHIEFEYKSAQLLGESQYLAKKVEKFFENK